MKPQRTILISTPYFPPYGGGLERYAYEVATRLSHDFDWHIVVVTSGEYCGTDTTEEMDGLTIYRLSCDYKVSNTPFSFKWFNKVKQIIRDERPDLINVHMPVPGIGDIVAFAAGKIPLVVTYHAGSMKKGSFIVDTLIGAYEAIPLRLLLRRANRIVCSSDFLRDGFLKRYKAKSVTITPAVNTALFVPDATKKLLTPTVLFVAGLGSAEQHKGLTTLLDAMVLVKAKIPTVQLFVVGDGDMRSIYEAYANKVGLGSAVQFLGRLQGAVLVTAYQQASLFVLPSTNDSFSMVILEAMACGLPIISNRIGGIPTLVDDGVTGFLLTPHNVPLLAEKIQTVLSNTAEATALGAAGHAKAVQGFNWDRQSEAYSQLFGKVTALSKLLVAHVVAYYPPHVGGMEVVAKNASEQLVASGHNVRVITSAIGIPSNEYSNYTNPKVESLWAFEFAHIPFTPALFWRLIRLPKHSLMHLHLAQAYYPEMVLLISKLRGIPYVAHFHLDVGPSGVFGFLFIVYKKLFWGPVLRNARAVIACSSQQAEVLQSKFGVKKERITVIANGVSDEFFSKDPYVLPTETLRLLYVGRLALQKRVDRIINAIALLKIPVHLTIVGDGEERQKLEVLVQKLGLEHRVSFEGMKNEKEMQQYHTQSDLFLMSSDKEGGTPLVALEAMAAGLPVVGTNVSGIRDLLDGVGIVVDEPYPENLARAIEDIWQHPEKLLSLSEQSKQKAKDYTWTKFATELEKVYSKIYV